MNCYCPHCGFKNSYATAKPKKCQSCGDVLEEVKKAPARTSRPARYEEPEETFEEETFNFTIAAKREGNEGFMTVEQLRQSGVSLGRGADPNQAIKQTVETPKQPVNPFANRESGGAKKIRSASQGLRD
jgi:hypothetical protein